MQVTVLMATYNRRDYVAASIESVLGQRHADFELIIVDDHSTDGTEDIVKRYARQDGRIRVIRNPANKGVAESVNTGLAVARYDLIARHDDDDLMLPDRLGRQLDFMRKHPDVSVVSAWAWLVDESGRIIGRSCPKVDIERGVANLEPALFVNIIQPATIFRKRDVLAVGGYRNFRQLQDRDLWGRMVTSGYRIAVQPEFLVLHRRHGNSLMTTEFEETFESGDYIDANIVRRLRGEQEVTLSQYRQLEASGPLLVRLSRRRRRRSQIAFRQATLFYGGRRWLPLVRSLTVAMALSPLETSRRLIDKVELGAPTVAAER
jgi:glycosyltransferase involved in cell wall biosynthesis